MTPLFPLTVGPITGYTTANSVRIFGRGEFKPVGVGYQRCHGIARIRKAGAAAFTKMEIFKMNPNFDFTGIVEFSGLQPDTAYSYEIGYFFDEREPDKIDLKTEIKWKDASKSTVQTARTANAAIDFAFGSCRYLLKLFLKLNLFDDRGDKIFRSMLEQVDKKKMPLDLVMMVGDQIYADDLNFLGADSFLEQYYSRYRDAFTQENVRELMSRIPTYMILDDHEIEDNWPTKAVQSDWQHKYPNAIHAYQTYQASHSPVLEMVNGRAVGTPDKFWYSFDNAGSTFFVMDTRTERYVEGDASTWRIVSKTQLKALKDWLSDAKNKTKTKFVVSGVPIFPDFVSDSGDKWGGFITQRSELLDFIADKDIRKVVFLSGDVHCSLSVQIVAESRPDLKMTSIVSSSFFWPYPQGKQKDFQLIGYLKTQGSSRYQLVNAGEVVSVDNFTRVRAEGDRLTVTVYDRKGEEKNKQVINL